jgi:hypothetical protein
VDPAVTGERKAANPAEQRESAESAESPAPPKSPKLSPDRRSPATNKVGKTTESKATPKVDASAKRMIPDVKPPISESGSHPEISVKTIASQASGDAAEGAMPAAKTDSVPKSDEERPKQVMEAVNTPKGKAEADRKE